MCTDDLARNRQDAREALDIAARGKVKCYYVVKGLGDLKEYVSRQWTLFYNWQHVGMSSVYEGMEKGTVAGRVVLEMNK